MEFSKRPRITGTEVSTVNRFRLDYALEARVDCSRFSSQRTLSLA